VDELRTERKEKEDELRRKREEEEKKMTAVASPVQARYRGMKGRRQAQEAKSERERREAKKRVEEEARRRQVEQKEESEVPFWMKLVADTDNNDESASNNRTSADSGLLEPNSLYLLPTAVVNLESALKLAEVNKASSKLAWGESQEDEHNEELLLDEGSTFFVPGEEKPAFASVGNDRQGQVHVSDGAALTYGDSNKENKPVRKATEITTVETANQKSLFAARPLSGDVDSDDSSDSLDIAVLHAKNQSRFAKFGAFHDDNDSESASRKSKKIAREKRVNGGSFAMDNEDNEASIVVDVDDDELDLFMGQGSFGGSNGYGGGEKRVDRGLTSESGSRRSGSSRASYSSGSSRSGKKLSERGYASIYQEARVLK